MTLLVVSGQRDCISGCVTGTQADGTTGNIGWDPIGSITTRGDFTATFEGNDNTISNLYINRSSAVGGLFGIIDRYAEIRNLALKEVSVTVTATTGSAFAGGTGRGELLWHNKWLLCNGKYRGNRNHR